MKSQLFLVLLLAAVAVGCSQATGDLSRSTPDTPSAVESAQVTLVSLNVPGMT